MQCTGFEDPQTYLGGLCSLLSNREVVGINIAFSLRAACRAFKNVCDCRLEEVKPAFKISSLCGAGSNLLEDLKKGGGAQALVRYAGEPCIYVVAATKMPLENIRLAANLGSAAKRDGAAVLQRATGAHSGLFRIWYAAGAVVGCNVEALRGCADVGGGLAEMITQWLVEDMVIPGGVKPKPRHQEAWLRAVQGTKWEAEFLNGTMMYSETVRRCSDIFAKEWVRKCDRYAPMLFAFNALHPVLAEDDADLLDRIVGDAKRYMGCCTTVLDYLARNCKGTRCLSYIVELCGTGFREVDFGEAREELRRRMLVQLARR